MSVNKFDFQRHVTCWLKIILFSNEWENSGIKKKKCNNRNDVLKLKS